MLITQPINTLQGFNPAPYFAQNNPRFPQNLDLLEEARSCYYSWANFRERRKRSRDYAKGDANEKFYDDDNGEWTTEDAKVRSQGRIPWKMRLIRPVIRNLRGQFRQNKTDRICFARNRDANDEADMMTEGLRYITDINQLDSVDADAMEEDFIGGLYGWKTVYKWNNELNKPEVFVAVVDPTRMFMNNDIRDRRLFELTIIGEIHDLTWNEVVSAFAETPEDEQALKQIFPQGAAAWRNSYYNSAMGRFLVDQQSFYQPVNPNKCRVVEVWKKEYGWYQFLHDQATGEYMLAENVDEALIANLNAQRMVDARLAGLENAPQLELVSKHESVWRVHYLSSFGHILAEAENSPYWHELHPYTIGLGSFSDGEVSGVVEDLIDPQRWANRLVTNMDFMMGVGAKGVLLVDEDMIPEGMSVQDFANEWVKFNGVIAYKPKTNNPVAMPKQITANSIPADTFTVFTMMEQKIKDISGVHDAQQGLQPPSGTPATLYEAQIMQGQLTSRDYFDSFFEARRMRDLKIVKLIAQFWDTPRKLKVKGRRADGQKFILYDPDRVRNIEYDIVLSEIADTATARQAFEADLQKLLDAQRITFRQYLMSSAHPKADYLLNLIETTNPLLGQQAAQDPQAMLQMKQQLMLAAQAGDPDAIAMLNQAA